MGVQASWGPMVWMVSTDQLRSLESISAAVELDLDSGDDKEGSSATNNKGLKSQVLSLSYQSSVIVGTDTLEDYDQWCSLIGQYAPFYLNGKRFGPKQMQLTKVDLSNAQLNPRGEIILGDIGITFTEYGNEPSELKPTPAAEADTEALGLKIQEQRKSAAGITASAQYKDRKAGDL